MGHGPGAGVLAASSLYIYLTHWQVYPHLRDHELLALVASLAVGIGYAAVATRLWVRCTRVLAGLRDRRPVTAGRGGRSDGERR